MSGLSQLATDRRALLAGIGGLAAGTLLSPGRMEAGPLNPPGAPNPTSKPLGQIEPRVAINEENTPGDGDSLYVIKDPGSYYLTANLGGESQRHGIYVMADDVTIDLMGFVIEGSKVSSTSHHAILVDPRVVNVQILNGRIRSWPGVGVSALSVRNAAIISLDIDGQSGEDGIQVGPQSLVRNCTANDRFVGIIAEEGSRVEACRVSNVQGDGIQIGPLGQVLNCVVQNGLVAGVRVLGGEARVAGCDILKVGNAGVFVASGERSIIESNSVSASEAGLRCETAGNIIRENTVHGNTVNYTFVAGNQLELLLSQIPQTISWPANIKLAGSLTGISGAGGIVIEADDVTVDLCGHSLIGVTGSTQGIQAANRRIIVRNGTVRDWGTGGVISLLSPGSHFAELAIFNCGSVGLQAARSLVENCICHGQTGYGFNMGSASILRGCIARNNGIGGYNIGYGCTVENCSAEGNSGTGFRGAGIFEGAGSASVISNCTAASNTGNGFLFGQNEILINCNARQNQEYGFHVSFGNLVESSMAAFNVKGGILVDGSNCTVRGCHATNNTSGEPGVGILISAGGRHSIEGNKTLSNKLGIVVNSAGNLVVRNVAGNNSLSNYSLVADNKVGTIVIPPNSAAISGTTGGAGVGTTDPWANITF